MILSHGEILAPSDLPIDFSDEELVINANGGMDILGEMGSENGAFMGQHDSVLERSGTTLREAAELIMKIESGTPMQDAIEGEIQKLEKGVIISALERNRWRRGETANFLGVSRRNLLRKMQKLGIE